MWWTENSFTNLLRLFDFASGPKGHGFLAHGSARLEAVP